MSDSDSRQQQLDAWLALTGQAPASGRSVLLPVLSGSMLPWIAPGAEIEIELVKGRDCRVGDVAVFLQGERCLTAHRVLLDLRLGSRQWVLQKGDNNAIGHWIDGSRIRGRVRRVFPAETGPEGREEGLGDPDLARAGRWQHLRNLVLHWPRRIRDFLSPARRRGPRE